MASVPRTSVFLDRATRIMNARAALRAALEACPHWDLESDGVGHTCCDEVQAAQADYITERTKET